MNKFYLAFILAVGFSTSVWAQTKPTFPGYANCPVSNGVINAACVSDVNYTYNAALALYNKSLGLVTDTYSGTTAPVKPTYSCTSNADGTVNVTCENAYATQMQQYNTQLSSYSALQQQHAETAQLQAAAAQARLLTTTASTSTTAALSTAIEENKKGAKVYTAVSVVTAGVAAVYAAKAMACSASGCAPPLWTRAAIFAGFSVLAMTQVKSHNSSAAAACASLNQLSTSSSDCSAAADTYTSTTPAGQVSQIADQIDTSTGKCKPSAPATCTTIVDTATEQGVDVKSLVGAASQFAGTNPAVKVNADGSVTTKDGKTYKPSDFKDEAAMVAAGLSASDAQALSSQLNGAGGILAKAGLDAKGDLKDAAKQDLGSFASFGGAGSSGSESGDGSNGSKSALGSKDMSAGKRKPSSSDQGLIRSFNGDSIGIANDDIFKMVNKRYKLKSAQDTFIGP